MKYLILSQDSEEYAKQLSTLVFNLIVPLSIRDSGQTTTELYPWIKHPTTGRVAIVVPDLAKDREIYIHPDADVNHVIDILEVQLPVSEINKLRADVDFYRGDRIDIAAVLPQTFFSQVVTEAAMEADGWFVGPES